MKQLFLLSLTAFASCLFGQQLPKLKLVEGGTQQLGGGYQYAVKDYYMVLLGNDAQYAQLHQDQIPIGEVPKENNPTRQVTVASFYIGETEVSNAQYRQFLVESLLKPCEKADLAADLKAAAGKNGTAGQQRAAWQTVITKAAISGLLPDTNCWVRDFVFNSNEPLVKNYLWHKAFDEYPVVGVSWDQATAYCKWLTEYVNADRAKQGKDPLPAYRLPTEMEWEYAAKGMPEGPNSPQIGGNYPWQGNAITDSKGSYLANIKVAPGNYIGDNYEYTAPVRSFDPQANHLYHMAGNVSEWCEDVFRFQKSAQSELNQPAQRDKIQLFGQSAEESTELRVVKGGSWADYRYAALVGSRTGQPKATGSSRTGFRVAMTKPQGPQ